MAKFRDYSSLRRYRARGLGRDSHIGFDGIDVDATRSHLRSLGLHFDEAPVPGWPLIQLFVKDPLGLKVEITFSTNVIEAV